MLALYCSESLEPRFLTDFRELADRGIISKYASKPGHKSGWGIVVYENEKPVYMGRYPTNAMDDPRYLEACEQIKKMSFAGIAFAHLRKASHGEICTANTHPFVYNNWTFAHNGGVEGLERPNPIPLEGNSDSERLFKHIIRRVEQGREFNQALKETVYYVRANHKFTSLTFIMSDGRSIYGYRELRREPEYYTLFYTRTNNAVIICQEPLWGLNWHEVRNRCLVAVNPNLRIKEIEF
jgi:predicted glutamine amidotransferase